MSVLKIVIALVMFGIIIFVHELGHFLVAKACGVRVNEFAMGMGPKLFSFGKKETVYSLRLLPFGGFCAMEGEDDESDDERAFGNKNVWQRMAVVVAGVVMNFLLGFLVLLVCLGFFMPLVDGQVLYGTTTIAQLEENTSSYQSGLRPGDTVISINSRGTLTTNDMMLIMQSDDDGVMPMMVKRVINGETHKVSLPEVKFDLKTTEDGTRYLHYDFVLYGKPQTVLSTVTQSLMTEWSLVTTVWWSLA
ncbi:MAG: site-2 protease family protein, partial [Clostridia bacterium]|nr:site-2 protease family protein [Clostridia bacterium]